MAQNGNSRRIGLAVCVVAALLISPMVLTPAAPAQSVIDQYQPRSDGPGGSDGSDGTGVGPSELVAERVPGGDIGPAANTAAVGGGGGELPITDYPLTPLVIALLILLAAGIAIRTAVEVRARFEARDRG